MNLSTYISTQNSSRKEVISMSEMNKQAMINQRKIFDQELDEMEEAHYGNIESNMDFFLPQYYKSNQYQKVILKDVEHTRNPKIKLKSSDSPLKSKEIPAKEYGSFFKLDSGSSIPPTEISEFGFNQMKAKL